MPKKILFIVAHRPGRSPGQRFRFEQYLDYLQNNGFAFEYSYLISEKDDKVFYSKGHYIQKFIILLKSIFTRLRDINRAKHYDIIFVYREAVMFGSTWFEKRLKAKCKKMVLDFDDAIWLMDTSEGNKNLQWLKRPSKTADILRMSDMAFVGNSYLANYALQHNSNVHVIPTTLDTDYYKRSAERTVGGKICIGWTGSSTTIKHLQYALPILTDIKNKYPQVCFRVISDQPLVADNLKDLENIKWSKESEVSDLEGIDIGIMPLPDDLWAKGKCGFKGLQYMAMEVATVMSPVGVNTEIIEEGHNGLLADTHEEWVEKLSMLIESKELRDKLGKNGRKTVVDRFSFHSQKDRYVELLGKL